MNRNQLVTLAMFGTQQQPDTGDAAELAVFAILHGRSQTQAAGRANFTRANPNPAAAVTRFTRTNPKTELLSLLFTRTKPNPGS